MTVADDVTLDDLILAKDDLSGADIKVREQQFISHIQNCNGTRLREAAELLKN